MATSSVQFSRSVVSDSLQPHGLQDARTPCSPPTPGVYSNHCDWVGDAIQPSHLLSSSSPPAFNLSQHRGLFQWVSCLHQVAKVLEFQPQHLPSSEYLGLISFKIDWLDLCSWRDSQESSPTPQFKSINYPALSFLYSTTLISIHDYWKNHSFDYVDLCQ